MEGAVQRTKPAQFLFDDLHIEELSAPISLPNGERRKSSLIYRQA